MTVPSQTYQTYQEIGIREDLADVIYRIDPVDTPFMSAIETEKATATKHEWQTQALAAPDTTNAVVEGDDANTDAATPTVRLYSYTQISDKVGRVSGTARAVDAAGRDDEYDYQRMLKGLELKRDIESILLNRQVSAAGSTSVARTCCGVPNWIFSNDVFATDGGSASTSDGTNNRTEGTQRAFTELDLKASLQLAWTNGGKPDMILVGGFNKQRFSTFTGRSTPIEQATSKTIVAAVDTYESDFGRLRVVPDRFSRARDVLILQTDMWAVAYLRKFESADLAKTGDSDRFQILSEYCLVSRNEKASGGVFDLTTS